MSFARSACFLIGLILYVASGDRIRHGVDLKQAKEDLHHAQNDDPEGGEADTAVGTENDAEEAAEAVAEDAVDEAKEADDGDETVEAVAEDAVDEAKEADDGDETVEAVADGTEEADEADASEDAADEADEADEAETQDEDGEEKEDEETTDASASQETTESSARRRRRDPVTTAAKETIASRSTIDFDKVKGMKRSQIWALIEDEDHAVQKSAEIVKARKKQHAKERRSLEKKWKAIERKFDMLRSASAAEKAEIDEMYKNVRAHKNDIRKLKSIVYKR